VGAGLCECGTSLGWCVLNCPQKGAPIQLDCRSPALRRVSFCICCCKYLQESRAELLQAFQDHPWLNMLHLHVGSQGLNLDTVIAGARCILIVLQLETESAGLVCGIDHI
jgi:hypothetical protein